MPDHSSKTTQPTKPFAAAHETGKKSLSSESGNERNAVHSPKNLAGVANESPQVKQLKAFQEMATASGQQQKANYFHELANGGSPIVQRQESPAMNVIQLGGKNDPVTNELRTPHKKW